MAGSEIKIEGISKSFGDVEVLDKVGFTIKPGEFFSILGPSGCGKTTLLRIIAGLETPDAGSVLMDGSNIIPLPPNKRLVNTVFQNYALFPHLSIFENVAFPLRLKRFPKDVINERVQHYLELVKLKGQQHKKPDQLSGGQKQRVAIARALINEPSVLLLDEPLSALDAKLRQHMLIELDTIHDEVGITFIYVTHDQQEAISVSDRVAIMNRGHILQIGAPFEIYESPANTFVAGFIGEANIFHGSVTRVEGDMVWIAIGEFGTIRVTTDDPIKTGNRVAVTIRPEKIRISRNASLPSDEFNIHSGFVDEVIYTGFQSKFFVKTPSGIMFKIFKQHINYFDDGPEITWQDDVSIWWHPEDGYIVEVLHD